MLLTATTAYVIPDVNNVGVRFAAFLQQGGKGSVQKVGNVGMDPHHLLDGRVRSHATVFPEPV